jgi:hypothetical protein
MVLAGIHFGHFLLDMQNGSRIPTHEMMAVDYLNPLQDDPMATTKRPEETTPSNDRPATLTVKWDDADITNSYANVCNVSSSREEVVLVFGMNKAWEKGGTDIKVKLSNRIILSPFAAKRLSLLLTNVLNQYETRFGPLNLMADTRTQAEPAGEMESVASRK